MERPLCTVQEVINDLDLSGDSGLLMRRIEQASQAIERKIGNFIPITETLVLDGPGTTGLKVDPLLAVTELKEDDEILSSSDYLLYSLKGRKPLWWNGPYTRIEKEDESAWSSDYGAIEITGRSGLYEETESLGVNITQATSAETTLVVTNGALVEKGMVLLIENEQELAYAYGSTTALTSKLAGKVDSTDIDITIDNGAEVNAGEVLIIGTEELYIKKVVGNVLVVRRQWNGTVSAAHADDSTIYVYRTYKVKRGVNGTTAAAHAAKELFHYLVPGDVNWKARELTGLLIKKAETKFSGKSGNEELGEQYFNESAAKLDELAKNYKVISV